MTELAELLRDAAPSALPFDEDALSSRIRRRRHQRQLGRAGATVLVVLALVGGVAMVRRSSGSGVVDVGGRRPPASHVTTTAIPGTTAADGSRSQYPKAAPPMPRSGQLVHPSWVIGVDMLTPTSGVAVVSASTTCGEFCETRGSAMQAALASTTDGGASWRIQGAPVMGHLPDPPTTAQMAFVSTRRGDVLINGVVYVTADGGTHWTRLPGVVGAESLIAVGTSLWITGCAFVGCTNNLTQIQVGSASGGVTRAWTGGSPVRTSLTGAVASGPDRGNGPTAQSTLVVTADAGATWSTPRAVPCPDNVPLGGMTALDATHWWILCQISSPRLSNATVELFETTDAGGTWRLLDAASDAGVTWHTPGAASDGSGTQVGDLGYTPIDSITVGDGGSILWVTDMGGVRASIDSGRTWVYGADGMTDALSATLSSAGTRAAWIALQGSGLWRTTDGVHWTR